MHNYYSYDRNRPNYNNNQNNKYGQNKSIKFRVNLNKDRDEDSDMNSLINQSSIKQQIIKYIYDSLEISKFKFKLIEFDYDLTFLKETKYFVSPNYNGITGLLVFTRIKDKYFSFIVDRRTLSYNPNQVDIEKVKIYPVKCRLDKSIYEGSIIDGILLYNSNSKNRNKTFIINDIYFFRGEDLTSDQINFKLLNINTFFEKFMIEDQNLNNINLVVNKLYELGEIKQLINNYIPKSKFSNSIKGITFYPIVSGTKLIYLYKNSSQTNDDNPNPQPLVTSPIIKTIKNINLDVTDSLTGIFRIKKTETVDVYVLYLAKITQENNKKLLTYKKFCLAYVPNKESSSFCKEIFENTNQEYALVECKYLPDKNKWTPFRLATDKKRPTELQVIEEAIKKYQLD